MTISLRRDGRARLVVGAVLVGWLVAFVLPAYGQKTQPASEQTAQLQRAATLVSAQDFKRAEAELDLILKAAPQEARALNLLGVVRAQQNRADEAEELFQRALRADPQLAGAHVNLGLLHLSQERWDEAVAEFAAALKIDPTRNDARSHLTATLRRMAAAALAHGDREQALSLLLRARNAAPDDADVLFEFGMTALGLALNEDAAQALEMAHTKRPDDPKIIYALGRARLAVSALADAEELFKRYVALAPRDASGHYGLGYTLALARRNDEAAAAFKRSLELRPEQTEAPYQLGLIAFAGGNIDGVDGAAAWFEKVRARYADHTGALVGLGLVQFNRKHYDLARATLERAIALNPSLAKAHYHLGLTLARLGEKEAAARETELAAKLEREQKEQRRVILRLLENEPDARPAPKPQ